MEELYSYTVSEASKLIKDKKVSPVELTKSCIERIKKIDDKINAFVFLNEEEALKSAQQAESQIASGNYLGPYHGIPMGFKDLYRTKGITTAGGSKILKNYVPDFDCQVVALMKKAGVILLGKTNTHEFAFGATTDSPWFGPTHNPWDLERVPGGSSGGSAAAIAADMCLAATGSDTGGSIRIPAMCCGVVGLKPTFGRCSKFGVLVLSWSLDHTGPVVKCVEDAALMLQIIAGKDPKDPTTRDVPVDDYTKNLKAGVKGLKAGIPKEHFFDYIEPEIESAVRKAIKELEALGMSVEEVSLPNMKYAEAAEFAIILAEAAAYHEKNIAERPEDYSGQVRTLMELGCFVTAVDYIKAQRVRRLVKDDYDEAFKKVDVLLTPTLPTPPNIIGQAMMMVAGREESPLDALWRYTYPLNLTGSPVISVPCGFTGANLPIGLQVIGADFNEAAVLRVAYAYETATDWHKRKPSL